MLLTRTEPTPGTYETGLDVDEYAGVELQSIECKLEGGIMEREDVQRHTDQGLRHLPSGQLWRITLKVLLQRWGNTTTLHTSGQDSTPNQHNLVQLLRAMPMLLDAGALVTDPVSVTPRDSYLVTDTLQNGIVPFAARVLDVPGGNETKTTGTLCVLKSLSTEGGDKPVVAEIECVGLFVEDPSAHGLSLGWTDDIVYGNRQNITSGSMVLTHGVAGSAGAVGVGAWTFETGQKIDVVTDDAFEHGYGYAFVRHDGSPKFTYEVNAIDESSSGFQVWAAGAKPATPVDFKCVLQVRNPNNAAAMTPVLEIAMPSAEYMKPEPTTADGRARVKMVCCGTNPTRNAQYSLKFYDPSSAAAS